MDNIEEIELKIISDKEFIVYHDICSFLENEYNQIALPTINRDYWYFDDSYYTLFRNNAYLRLKKNYNNGNVTLCFKNVNKIDNGIYYRNEYTENIGKDLDLYKLENSHSFLKAKDYILQYNNSNNFLHITNTCKAKVERKIILSKLKSISEKSDEFINEDFFITCDEVVCFNQLNEKTKFYELEVEIRATEERREYAKYMLHNLKNYLINLNYQMSKKNKYQLVLETKLNNMFINYNS